MNKIRITSLIAMMITLVQLTGCASSRKSAWEQETTGTSLTAAETSKLMNEAKKLWATRNVRSDLENALSKFKTIVGSDPSNYEALTYLTRGYYLLADGILQEPAEKKANWETSVYWGEKGLATNPEFKKSVVDEKNTVADSVKFLNKQQLDALYWTAASLGKWAKMSGIVTTLQYKSQIIKMIDRVAELQPDYFYGAVHRYWGVYYAVAPGFAGGSLEKSLERFKTAFKAANLYLGTHVLYAENYAVKKGDRDLFKKELEFVLSAKANGIPELEPEHLLEKEKAKKLLANMEQYF